MSFSFFPWMGGKTRLAKQIVGLLPSHTCYVEVFAGGANILFAKPPSKAEVINDVNGDLVGLFRVVKYHRREFLRQLQFLTHSRREFADCKAQPGLTDCQRAARFDLTDHRRLADQLRTIKGKFLVSINDHPTIRQLYKGLTIRPVQTTYSVSRDKAAAAKPRGELLIANYKFKIKH